MSDITGQLGNSYNFSERNISYNIESMPTSIVDIMEDGVTTQTTLFKYDGNNVRVKKDAPNGIETYYIGNHYEVKDGQVTKYIFGNNMRIAQVKGSEKHFFHKDHLGSSTVMSDANGERVEYTEYMPFGKTRSHVGQDISDYKFTDQELDKSTGFYNYDTRLYDPLIGRFVTADSIVPDWFDPQSLNRYSYVRNNPIKYVDPEGESFLVAFLIALVCAVTGEWSDPSISNAPDVGDATYNPDTMVETIGKMVIPAAGAVIAYDTLNNDDKPDVSKNDKLNETSKNKNGNALDSEKPQHGYVVKRKGEIQEYGISGQKETKKGTSPRAQTKKREKYGNDPDVTHEIIKRKMSNRRKADSWEKGKVRAYKKAHPENLPPPKQKRPKVD